MTRALAVALSASLILTAPGMTGWAEEIVSPNDEKQKPAAPFQFISHKAPGDSFKPLIKNPSSTTGSSNQAEPVASKNDAPNPLKQVYDSVTMSMQLSEAILRHIVPQSHRLDQLRAERDMPSWQKKLALDAIVADGTHEGVAVIAGRDVSPQLKGTIINSDPRAPGAARNIQYVLDTWSDIQGDGSPNGQAADFAGARPIGAQTSFSARNLLYSTGRGDPARGMPTFSPNYPCAYAAGAGRPLNGVVCMGDKGQDIEDVTKLANSIAATLEKDLDLLAGQLRAAREFFISNEMVRIRNEEQSLKLADRIKEQTDKRDTAKGELAKNEEALRLQRGMLADCYSSPGCDGSVAQSTISGLEADIRENKVKIADAEKLLYGDPNAPHMDQRPLSFDRKTKAKDGKGGLLGQKDEADERVRIANEYLRKVDEYLSEIRSDEELKLLLNGREVDLRDEKEKTEQQSEPRVQFAGWGDAGEVDGAGARRWKEGDVFTVRFEGLGKSALEKEAERRIERDNAQRSYKPVSGSVWENHKGAIIGFAVGLALVAGGVALGIATGGISAPASVVAAGKGLAMLGAAAAIVYSTTTYGAGHDIRRLEEARANQAELLPSDPKLRRMYEELEKVKKLYDQAGDKFNEWQAAQYGKNGNALKGIRETLRIHEMSAAVARRMGEAMGRLRDVYGGSRDAQDLMRIAELVSGGYLSPQDGTRAGLTAIEAAKLAKLAPETRKAYEERKALFESKDSYFAESERQGKKLESARGYMMMRMLGAHDLAMTSKNDDSKKMYQLFARTYLPSFNPDTGVQDVPWQGVWEYLSPKDAYVGYDAQRHMYSNFANAAENTWGPIHDALYAPLNAYKESLRVHDDYARAWVARIAATGGNVMKAFSDPPKQLFGEGMIAFGKGSGRESDIGNWLINTGAAHAHGTALNQSFGNLAVHRLNSIYGTSDYQYFYDLDKHGNLSTTTGIRNLDWFMNDRREKMLARGQYMDNASQLLGHLNLLEEVRNVGTDAWAGMRLNDWRSAEFWQSAGQGAGVVGLGILQTALDMKMIGVMNQGLSVWKPATLWGQVPKFALQATVVGVPSAQFVTSFAEDIGHFFKAGQAYAQGDFLKGDVLRGGSLANALSIIGGGAALRSHMPAWQGLAKSPSWALSAAGGFMRESFAEARKFAVQASIAGLGMGLAGEAGLGLGAFGSVLASGRLAERGRSTMETAREQLAPYMQSGFDAAKLPSLDFLSGRFNVREVLNGEGKTPLRYKPTLMERWLGGAQGMEIMPAQQVPAGMDAGEASFRLLAGQMKARGITARNLGVVGQRAPSAADDGLTPSQMERGGGDRTGGSSGGKGVFDWLGGRVAESWQAAKAAYQATPSLQELGLAAGAGGPDVQIRLPSENRWANAANAFFRTMGGNSTAGSGGANGSSGASGPMPPLLGGRYGRALGAATETFTKPWIGEGWKPTGVGVVDAGLRMLSAPFAAAWKAPRSFFESLEQSRPARGSQPESPQALPQTVAEDPSFIRTVARANGGETIEVDVNGKRIRFRVDASQRNEAQRMLIEDRAARDPEWVRDNMPNIVRAATDPQKADVTFEVDGVRINSNEVADGKPDFFARLMVRDASTSQLQDMAQGKPTSIITAAPGGRAPVEVLDVHGSRPLADGRTLLNGLPPVEGKQNPTIRAAALRELSARVARGEAAADALPASLQRDVLLAGKYGQHARQVVGWRTAQEGAQRTQVEITKMLGEEVGALAQADLAPLTEAGKTAFVEKLAELRTQREQAYQAFRELQQARARDLVAFAAPGARNDDELKVMERERLEDRLEERTLRVQLLETELRVVNALGREIEFRSERESRESMENGPVGNQMADIKTMTDLETRAAEIRNELGGLRLERAVVEKQRTVAEAATEADRRAAQRELIEAQRNLLRHKTEELIETVRRHRDPAKEASGKLLEAKKALEKAKERETAALGFLVELRGRGSATREEVLRAEEIYRAARLGREAASAKLEEVQIVDRQARDQLELAQLKLHSLQAEHNLVVAQMRASAGLLSRWNPIARWQVSRAARRAAAAKIQVELKEQEINVVKAVTDAQAGEQVLAQFADVLPDAAARRNLMRQIREALRSRMNELGLFIDLETHVNMLDVLVKELENARAGAGARNFNSARTLDALVERVVDRTVQRAAQGLFNAADARIANQAVARLRAEGVEDLVRRPPTSLNAQEQARLQLFRSALKLHAEKLEAAGQREAAEHIRQEMRRVDRSIRVFEAISADQAVRALEGQGVRDLMRRSPGSLTSQERAQLEEFASALHHRRYALRQLAQTESDVAQRNRLLQRAEQFGREALSIRQRLGRSEVGRIQADVEQLARTGARSIDTLRTRLEHAKARLDVARRHVLEVHPQARERARAEVNALRKEVAQLREELQRLERSREITTPDEAAQRPIFEARTETQLRGWAVSLRVEERVLRQAIEAVRAGVRERFAFEGIPTEAQFNRRVAEKAAELTRLNAAQTIGRMEHDTVARLTAQIEGVLEMGSERMLGLLEAGLRGRVDVHFGEALRLLVTPEHLREALRLATREIAQDLIRTGRSLNVPWQAVPTLVMERAALRAVELAAAKARQEHTIRLSSNRREARTQYRELRERVPGVGKRFAFNRNYLSSKIAHGRAMIAHLEARREAAAHPWSIKARWHAFRTGLAAGEARSAYRAVLNEIRAQRAELYKETYRELYRERAQDPDRDLVQRLGDRLFGRWRAAQRAKARVAIEELMGAWSPERGADVSARNILFTEEQAKRIVSRLEEIIRSRSPSESWDRAFMQKWEHQRKAILEFLIKGDSLAFDMGVGLGKSLTGWAVVLARVLGHGVAEVDFLVKSVDEANKYFHATKQAIPGVPLTFIDLLQVAGRERGVEVSAHRMWELADAVREASTPEERSAALKAFEDAARDPHGLRMWTAESMGHLTTYGMGREVGKQVLDILNELASDPNKVLIVDEADALLTSPVNFVSSTQASRLGRVGLDYVAKYDRLAEAIGFSAEGRGSFRQDAMIARAESMDEHMRYHAMGRAAYYRTGDGTIFMTHAAQRHFKSLGVWQQGIAERMINGIEQRHEYGRGIDLETGHRVIAPISAAEGSIQFNMIMQDTAFAFALSRANGANSTQALLEVRESMTHRSTPGLLAFVGSRQVLLMSGSMRDAEFMSDALKIDVESYGDPKDVYLESHFSRGHVLDHARGFIDKQAHANFVIETLLGATRRGTEGPLQGLEEQRGLFQSKDAELRRLVIEGLRERGLTFEGPQRDVVLFDETATQAEVELAIGRTGAGIIIGTHARAGRGANYEANLVEGVKSAAQRYKFGILEIVNATDASKSELEQTLGRVDRYEGQMFRRIVTVDLADVAAEAAAAYRSDVHDLLVAAGEARAGAMKAEQRWRAYRDADGRVSGLELLKTKSFDQLTLGEQIKVAALKRELDNSSLAMLTNGPGLLEHMFLKGPLQLLARGLREGSYQERIVNKYLTKLLNREFYQPTAMEKITGVFDGTERMKRALEGVQGEALQAMRGIQRELSWGQFIRNPIRWTLEKVGVRANALRDVVSELHQQWEDVKFRSRADSTQKITEPEIGLQQMADRIMARGRMLSPTLGGTRHTETSGHLAAEVARARKDMASGGVSAGRLASIRRLAGVLVKNDSMAARDTLYMTLATSGDTAAALGAPTGQANVTTPVFGWVDGIRQRTREFRDHWSTARELTKTEGPLKRTLGSLGYAFSNTFAKAPSPEKLWEANQRMLLEPEPTMPAPAPMSSSQGTSASSEGGATLQTVHAFQRSAVDPVGRSGPAPAAAPVSVAATGGNTAAATDMTRAPAATVKPDAKPLSRTEVAERNLLELTLRHPELQESKLSEKAVQEAIIKATIAGKDAKKLHEVLTRAREASWQATPELKRSVGIVVSGVRREDGITVIGADRRTGRGVLVVIEQFTAKAIAWAQIEMQRAALTGRPVEVVLPVEQGDETATRALRHTLYEMAAQARSEALSRGLPAHDLIRFVEDKDARLPSAARSGLARLMAARRRWIEGTSGPTLRIDDIQRLAPKVQPLVARRESINAEVRQMREWLDSATEIVDGKRDLPPGMTANALKGHIAQVEQRMAHGNAQLEKINQQLEPVEARFRQHVRETRRSAEAIVTAADKGAPSDAETLELARLIVAAKDDGALVRAISNLAPSRRMALAKETLPSDTLTDAFVQAVAKNEEFQVADASQMEADLADLFVFHMRELLPRYSGGEAKEHQAFLAAFDGLMNEVLALKEKDYWPRLTLAQQKRKILEIVSKHRTSATWRASFPSLFFTGVNQALQLSVALNDESLSHTIQHRRAVLNALRSLQGKGLTFLQVAEGFEEPARLLLQELGEQGGQANVEVPSQIIVVSKSPFGAFHERSQEMLKSHCWNVDQSFKYSEPFALSHPVAAKFLVFGVAVGIIAAVVFGWAAIPILAAGGKVAIALTAGAKAVLGLLTVPASAAAGSTVKGYLVMMGLYTGLSLLTSLVGKVLGVKIPSIMGQFNAFQGMDKKKNESVSGVSGLVWKLVKGLIPIAVILGLPWLMGLALGAFELALSTVGSVLVSQFGMTATPEVPKMADRLVEKSSPRLRAGAAVLAARVVRFFGSLYFRYGGIPALGAATVAAVAFFSASIPLTLAVLALTLGALMLYYRSEKWSRRFNDVAALHAILAIGFSVAFVASQAVTLGVGAILALIVFKRYFPNRPIRAKAVVRESETQTVIDQPLSNPMKRHRLTIHVAPPRGWVKADRLGDFEIAWVEVGTGNRGVLALPKDAQGNFATRVSMAVREGRLYRLHLRLKKGSSLINDRSGKPVQAGEWFTVEAPVGADLSIKQDPHRHNPGLYVVANPLSKEQLQTGAVLVRGRTGETPAQSIADQRTPVAAPVAVPAQGTQMSARAAQQTAAMSNRTPVVRSLSVSDTLTAKPPAKEQLRVRVVFRPFADHLTQGKRFVLLHREENESDWRPEVLPMNWHGGSTRPWFGPLPAEEWGRYSDDYCQTFVSVNQQRRYIFGLGRVVGKPDADGRVQVEIPDMNLMRILGRLEWGGANGRVVGATSDGHDLVYQVEVAPTLAPSPVTVGAHGMLQGMTAAQGTLVPPALSSVGSDPAPARGLTPAADFPGAGLSRNISSGGTPLAPVHHYGSADARRDLVAGGLHPTGVTASGAFGSAQPISRGATPVSHAGTAMSNTQSAAARVSGPVAANPAPTPAKKPVTVTPQGTLNGFRAPARTPVQRPMAARSTRDPGVRVSVEDMLPSTEEVSKPSRFWPFMRQAGKALLVAVAGVVVVGGVGYGVYAFFTSGLAVPVFKGLGLLLAGVIGWKWMERAGQGRAMRWATLTSLFVVGAALAFGAGAGAALEAPKVLMIAGIPASRVFIGLVLLVFGSAILPTAVSAIHTAVRLLTPSRTAFDLPKAPPARRLHGLSA